MLVALCCSSSYVHANIPSRPKDVRILISVSNSMAQNDPNNIRAAAVKMVARLLPRNTLAGIWMFDGNVQRLVPISKVSNPWILDAIESTSRIHSNGQMSNLAEALDVATLGWVHPDVTLSRHIILLTDDVVQVSNDDNINAESRAHILDTLLPKLKYLGVKIHSIALTGSADLTLLQQLSRETDGYYTRIESAEDLQRTFLAILDFSVIPAGLPIEENKFLIDKDTNEITLIVFTTSMQQIQKNNLIKLRAPNGAMYDINHVAKEMRWFQEGLAHVITIKNPMVGEWTFVGDLNLHKKATILSDLMFEVSELPSNLFVGEKISMVARLKYNNEILTNSPLLDVAMVTTEIHAENSAGQIFKLPVATNFNEENKGVFATTIGPIPSQFGNSLLATTKFLGKTLEREKVQRVNLLPVPIDMVTKIHLTDEKQKILTIKITPDPLLIKPETLLMSVYLMDNTNKNIKYEMPRNIQGSWELQITPDPNITEYKIKFELSAKTNLSRDIYIETAPKILAVPDIAIPDAKIVVVQEPHQEPETIIEEPITQTSTKTYVVGVMLFIVINVFMLAFGYFIYQMRKTLKAKKVEKLTKKIR